MQRVIFHVSVLSVFQIVKFKNGDCPASDGNRGVCFTGQQFLLHRDIIMKIKDVLNDKILSWSYNWRKLSLSQRRSAVARAALLLDPVLQALESAVFVSWIFCFLSISSKADCCVFCYLSFFFNLSLSCVCCVGSSIIFIWVIFMVIVKNWLWILIIASVYGSFRISFQSHSRLVGAQSRKTTRK